MSKRKRQTKREFNMAEAFRHTTRYYGEPDGVKRVPTDKQILKQAKRVMKRNVVFQVCLLKDDWWSYVPVWCKTKDSLATELFDMSLRCWSCYGVSWDGIYGRYELMVGPDPRYKTNFSPELVEYLVNSLHEGLVTCLYSNPC